MCDLLVALPRTLCHTVTHCHAHCQPHTVCHICSNLCPRTPQPAACTSQQVVTTPVNLLVVSQCNTLCLYIPQSRVCTSLASLHASMHNTSHLQHMYCMHCRDIYCRHHSICTICTGKTAVPANSATGCHNSLFCPHRAQSKRPPLPLCQLTTQQFGPTAV